MIRIFGRSDSVVHEDKNTDHRYQYIVFSSAVQYDLQLSSNVAGL
jgi:hypothetical protein